MAAMLSRIFYKHPVYGLQHPLQGLQRLIEKNKQVLGIVEIAH